GSWWRGWWWRGDGRGWCGAGAEWSGRLLARGFPRRDHLEVGVLHVFDGAPQRAGESRAMALDLAQNRVAARLRGHGHAVDALDLVNLERQGARHHRIHGQAGGGERGFDCLGGVFITNGPSPRDLIGEIPVEQGPDQLRHSFVRRGGQQMDLEAAQTKGVPNQIDHVAYPDLLEDIGRLQRARNAR